MRLEAGAVCLAITLLSLALGSPRFSEIRQRTFYLTPFRLVKGGGGKSSLSNLQFIAFFIDLLFWIIVDMIDSCRPGSSSCVGRALRHNVLRVLISSHTQVYFMQSSTFSLGARRVPVVDTKTARVDAGRMHSGVLHRSLSFQSKKSVFPSTSQIFSTIFQPPTYFFQGRKSTHF